MAHKALVNGTAYEIGGGKTLVDGTAYSIDKGKTMVGGTVYDVGFAVPVTITVTASVEGMAIGIGSITHNGITYNADAYNGQTITIDAFVGDIISCSATGYNANGEINVNGVRAATGSPAQYDYLVCGNTTIIIKARGNSSAGRYFGSGLVDITEQ